MIKIFHSPLIFMMLISGPIFGYDKAAYEKLKVYAKQDKSMRELVLSHKDLSGVDLNQLNLDGVTLRLCNLNGAQLVCTSFINANLVGCSFKNALFHFTDFRGADLRFVDFRCKISEKRQYLGLYLKHAASFQGSDLSSANFMFTRIDGIEFDDTTTMLGTLFMQAHLDDYCYIPKALWDRREIILTPNQYRYHMRERD